MFNNLIWKLLERFGVQGAQFILQIVLARILAPEDYGVLSLMIIFTTLANVLIQNGFNTSLIQNKDVTEEDYSSAFWVSLGTAVILYAVLFFAAPFIAEFYLMPEMVLPFRVLSLVLIPGALNSVQVAKVSREMNFKKVFYSNIAAIILSGAAGVIIAKMGGGIWALVAQNLLTVTVAAAVMLFTVKWHPKFVFNIKRVKVLFTYGWKLLASALIDTLHQNLNSMVIGKKYNADMLGYYNRGYQFPNFMISAVNGTVQSVLLPVLSQKQDSRENVKKIMRNSLLISFYIVCPMMAGLAAVSESMVTLVLTEKWLPCVSYLQIFCLSFAFWPVHTSNLQAINAIGRSDVFLKLEVVKKSYGLVALMIALLCFDSPIAIAMTSVIVSVISVFANAFPNKKLIGYSFREQMRDIFPVLVMSAVMFICVYAVGMIKSADIIVLTLQIIAGVMVYVIMSVIIKPQAYRIISESLKNLKRSR